MQKFSIILNFLLFIALIVVSFLLFNCQKESASLLRGEGTPGFWELTEYPDNLLEGRIVSLNLEEESISMIINVDVSKIIPNAGKMEKTIRIESGTELIFLELTPKEERLMRLNELGEGDYVVVATQESTRENVLTENTFTATRITKIREID